MDATPQPSDVDSDPPVLASVDQSGSFAEIVRAWHARGEAVPVAVVVSVFDDILATSVADDGKAAIDLEHVRVTPEGRAQLSCTGRLSAIVGMLMEALGADLPGDAVPPAAWGLFERLTSDDATESPMDAEQVRQWIRDSLGAPATHEEVQECAQEALAPAEEDLHELETLPPRPSDVLLPIPEPAIDEGMATLPPERSVEPNQISTDLVRKRELPRDLQPNTDVERATHLPEPLDDSLEPESETAFPTTIDASPPAPVQEARAAAVAVEEAEVLVKPVPDDETAMPQPLESELAAASAQPTAPARVDSDRVRHTLDRPVNPVSVVSAPAARRTAQSSPLGRDSIIGPADPRKAWAWVLVAAAICASVYFLFFR